MSSIDAKGDIHVSTPDASVSGVVKGPDSAPAQSDKKSRWKIPVPAVARSIAAALGLTALTVMNPGGSADAASSRPVPTTPGNQGGENPGEIVPADSPRRGPDVPNEDGGVDRTIWPMVPSNDALAQANTQVSSEPIVPADSPRRGPDIDLNGDGSIDPNKERTVWPEVQGPALAKAGANPAVGPLPAPSSGGEAPVLPMSQPGEDSTKA